MMTWDLVIRENDNNDVISAHQIPLIQSQIKGGL